MLNALRPEPELLGLLRDHPEIGVRIEPLPIPDLGPGWEVVRRDTDDRYRAWRTVEPVTVAPGVHRFDRYTADLERGYGVSWSEFEVESEEAAIWVFEHRLHPALLVAEQLFMERLSPDTLWLFERVRSLTMGPLDRYEEGLGIDLEEQIRLAQESLERVGAPTPETGWIEIHEGVWERRFEAGAFGGRRTQHFTEDPEALRWLVEEVLEPRAETAGEKIERLGYEEAERRGYVDDLRHYRLALPALENQRPALESTEQ